jgi:hypothetical protein
MARMLVETAVTVLDTALDESPPHARAPAEELKRMHRPYLEPCMRGEPRKG